MSRERGARVPYVQIFFFPLQTETLYASRCDFSINVQVFASTNQSNHATNHLERTAYELMRMISLVRRSHRFEEQKDVIVCADVSEDGRAVLRRHLDALAGPQ